MTSQHDIAVSNFTPRFRFTLVKAAAHITSAYHLPTHPVLASGRLGQITYTFNQVFVTEPATGPQHRAWRGGKSSPWGPNTKGCCFHAASATVREPGGILAVQCKYESSTESESSRGRARGRSGVKYRGLEGTELGQRSEGTEP